MLYLTGNKDSVNNSLDLVGFESLPLQQAQGKKQPTTTAKKPHKPPDTLVLVSAVQTGLGFMRPIKVI